MERRRRRIPALAVLISSLALAAAAEKAGRRGDLLREVGAPVRRAETPEEDQ